MATGRDATGVAITTPFGNAVLLDFQVFADEAVPKPQTNAH
jgi:hypothetical protein